MPAVRHFSELTKDFSPERRERIEQRKEQLRQEMTLAELRKAFSLTQDTLAKNLSRVNPLAAGQLPWRGTLVALPALAEVVQKAR
jgi:hypothetical protein